MEAAAFAGIETVLFLAPPTPARLRAFTRYRAIGVAGVARAQSPAWMEPPAARPCVAGVVHGRERPPQASQRRIPRKQA
ncbi:MAG: hypothetical protein JO227_24110 [Acetobacteraceae bacterium]|nr:hypothetical protein [Acetobacteraceae bacterium]